MPILIMFIANLEIRSLQDTKKIKFQVKYEVPKRFFTIESK